MPFGVVDTVDHSVSESAPLSAGTSHIHSHPQTQEVIQLEFREPDVHLPSSLTLLQEIPSFKTETAVRITYHGIQLEITNAAANDTVYQTLSALQRLY